MAPMQAQPACGAASIVEARFSRSPIKKVQVRGSSSWSPPGRWLSPSPWLQCC